MPTGAAAPRISATANPRFSWCSSGIFSGSDSPPQGAGQPPSSARCSSTLSSHCHWIHEQDFTGACDRGIHQGPKSWAKSVLPTPAASSSVHKPVVADFPIETLRVPSLSVWPHFCPAKSPQPPPPHPPPGFGQAILLMFQMWPGILSPGRTSATSTYLPRVRRNEEPATLGTEVMFSLCREENSL